MDKYAWIFGSAMSVAVAYGWVAELKRQQRLMADKIIELNGRIETLESNIQLVNRASHSVAEKLKSISS